MNKTILIKKNNLWYNNATGQQFIGIARIKGLTYRFTKSGQKVLLTKPNPNISQFVKKLWERENPNKEGFHNGKYYYYKTRNGNWDLGPGIDRSKQTNAFNQRAKLGFTPSEMNAEVLQRTKQNFQQVEQALKAVTQFPDTVSPQIKEGLADLRYQTGALVSTYPKLLKAVAKGDTKGLARESKVYFYDNNKKAMSFDKSRYNFRMENYFHYNSGGKLIPKKHFRGPIEEFKYYRLN